MQRYLLNINCTQTILKMKKILFFLITSVLFVGCINQRQRTNIVGRTDEVYFTPSDTRKKAVVNYSSGQSNTSNTYNNTRNVGNYTSTYSNRLSNFGTRNRFNYSNYQPVLLPSLFIFNNNAGWTYGLGYGNPRFGYGRSYSSSFSPYFGCYMPFNDPFFAYGWGGNWMTIYNPCYSYNPYMYNYGSYGYGYYGNYGNYNPYFNHKNNSNSNYNYSRRTYSNYPNTQTNSNTGNTGNTNNNWWNRTTNSNPTNNGGNPTGSGKWWNSGSPSTGGGNTGGGGNSGSGRATSGNTGGSARRR